MNCYDCAQTGTAIVTAVAVCSHCGAALCDAHVSACVAEIRRSNSVGFPTITDPPGRTLCCATCRDAGTGATRRAN